jgi:hypothetical protein
MWQANQSPGRHNHEIGTIGDPHATSGCPRTTSAMWPDDPIAAMCQRARRRMSRTDRPSPGELGDTRTAGWLPRSRAKCSRRTADSSPTPARVRSTMNGVLVKPTSVSTPNVHLRGSRRCLHHQMSRTDSDGCRSARHIVADLAPAGVNFCEPRTCPHRSARIAGSRTDPARSWSEGSGQGPKS